MTFIECHNDRTETKYWTYSMLWSEWWNENVQIRTGLEASEMLFQRRMIRMHRTIRVTNSDCPVEDSESITQYAIIWMSHTVFFGHTRREALERIVTTGKVIGRRYRGRQREMMLLELKEWNGGVSPIPWTLTTRYGTLTFGKAPYDDEFLLTCWRTIIVHNDH